MPPRASILLPVLDGEAHLSRLLPRLAEQDLEGGFEICAIDSSSGDRSRELCEEAGASVRTIPREAFRHGATRNELASEAQGEFLVFLSQDAEPAERSFLRHLLAAFEDPRVAGATARLLPRPDDDPLTTRTALSSPEASAEPRAIDLDRTITLDELPPRERAQIARFNNVASAIRASVFRQIPFPDVPFGEDAAWAALALEAGWRLRYVPEAAVWHAHRYSARGAFHRYRTDAEFHRVAHGWRVRPSAFSVARGWAYELRADLRYLAREKRPGRAKALLRAPILRAAQVLGQYSGSQGPVEE